MSKPIILCVDDESIVLNSLGMQFQRMLNDEFLFEFAENAFDALQIMEDNIAAGDKVVLVISDWLMPGMKGDEFLIKIHAKWPHIKKVLLTGQADSSAVYKIQSIGATLINKPWKTSDFADVFSSLKRASMHL